MEKLKSRLNSLPLVLAGPILRQVTTDAVTVWVALKGTANVKLTVFDSDKQPLPTPLMSATRKTTAIGKNLHIVAVTARKEKRLKENTLYFYDLEFLDAGLPKGTLAEAVTARGKQPDPELLAYPDTRLPSFALPPTDLNKLRLVHGSCRKPHGEGSDALALLDGLIGAKAESPDERPHQLMLTGDQVYADDVADALLAALTDAGDALLGWTPPESMPGVGTGSLEAAKLFPTTRTAVITKTGFTSGDTRSHLMSLGEYLAVHLFAWSDVLWTDLPTVTELKSMPGVSIDRKLETEIEKHRSAVDNYRKALPSVRRALANVPTYMSFDDHEITDDWNMTRKFCEDVYRSENGLGMRIVQNGLIAFAICQGWGNLPEQFAAHPNAPGFQLLKDLETVSQAPKDNASVYGALSHKFRRSVGLRPSSEHQKHKDFYNLHDPGGTSLRYHFSVEGPSHQIIVTDTRTWRTFYGRITHADLIVKEQFDAQLNSHELNNHEVPPLRNRLLLVVLSTNAPPIASIRLFARLAATTEYLFTYDLNESWEFPSRNFDHLIVALSSKLPLNGDTHTGQMIFLSGDVHFSFSSRLAYWADQRLGDVTGQNKKVEMVVGQLVASSFKNEEEKTRGMQTTGYLYLPAKVQGILKKVAIVNPLVASTLPVALVPPHLPEGYVGWNISKDKGLLVVGHRIPAWTKAVVGGSPLEILTVDVKSPTLPLNLSLAKGITLREKPHYRYRLDYLKTSRTGQKAPASPNIGSANSADRRAAARSHANGHLAHRNLMSSGATPPNCVGHNNIGEITFVWQQANNNPAASVNDPLATIRRVHHTVNWQEPKDGDVFWGQYNVSLNTKDGEKGGKFAQIDEKP